MRMSTMWPSGPSAGGRPRSPAGQQPSFPIDNEVLQHTVTGRATGPPGDPRERAMSDKRNPESDPGQPGVYQIRLKGHLGRQWTEWFGGLTIALEDNGDTLLTGPVGDQAALHGLLRKVRDLGMPLLSVNSVESAPAETLDVIEGSRASGLAFVRE